MTPKEKAVWVFTLSWLGIVLLVIGGIVWFPTLLREQGRVVALQAQLADIQTIERQARDFSEQVSQRVRRLTEAVASRAAAISVMHFTPRSQADIPGFLDELQDVFSIPGLSLLNMSYQSRLTEGRFVTLPFQASVQADYPSFRELVFALEAHRAGIRIDRLEFKSFDDDQHLLRVLLDCSVRFQAP